MLMPRWAKITRKIARSNLVEVGEPVWSPILFPFPTSSTHFVPRSTMKHYARAGMAAANGTCFSRTVLVSSFSSCALPPTVKHPCTGTAGWTLSLGKRFVSTEETESQVVHIHHLTIPSIYLCQGRLYNIPSRHHDRTV